MEKLPYYCYIDIFKQYTDRMPYFIGNCDVIIDNEKFGEIKECFIAQSVHTNPILKNKFKFREVPDAKLKIDNYFRELLESKFGKNMPQILIKKDKQIIKIPILLTAVSGKITH